MTPAAAHHEEGNLQWVSLGSAEVGTQGTIGALPWTSTGIYVPAGVEARVWLRGKLSVSYNQAFSRFCSLGFYAPIDCHGNGFDGHQVGGAGIDIYYLAADIRIRDGGNVREVGFGVPRGSDGDPVEAGVTGPGIIEVSRSGMDMPFTWQDLGTDQRYNVTGTQTLEVEALGRVDACGGVVLAGATAAEPTDCVPVPPKKEPKLVLSCPDVVIRGSNMDCSVTFQDGSGSVSGWTFAGESGSVEGPSGGLTWGGTMVVGGVMTARGTIEGVAASDSERIVVQPRAWPEIQLTRPPIKRIERDPRSMEAYPSGADPTKVFGRFLVDWVDIAAHLQDYLAVSRGSGPNQGLSYISEPLQLPAPTIFLHPALFPAGTVAFDPGDPAGQLSNQWYLDQNGRPSGTCRPADIARFEMRIEYHEGMTIASDSHYGKTNEALRRYHLARRLEAVVGEENADPLAAAGSILQAFVSGSYEPIQATFDNNDTPNVYSALRGCSLDFNPNDN